MNDAEVSKKLTWVIGLLTANLLAMGTVAVAIVFGLLPKVERAVQKAEQVGVATEKVQQRLQSFADEVQPVIAASAGKAIDTIKKFDADTVSKKATDAASNIIDAAEQRAKRLFDPRGGPKKD